MLYNFHLLLDLIKFLPTEEQTRINGLLDKVNGQYQKNKKLSIYIVEYLLKIAEDKKWLDFFNGHPKKDDLADSLLMTLHYFEKDNLAKIRKDDKKAEAAVDKKSGDKKSGDKKGKKVVKKADNDLDELDELDELLKSDDK